MKEKILILVLLFTLGSNQLLTAQSDFAAPLIKNFSKQVYQGGTQTWDIAEDSLGILYFANNDGLLRYDGRRFNRFSLPKKTILRSVLYDQNSERIYVGGQGEMGYFAYDTKGHLQYSPLENLLSDGQKGFEDIWNIERYQNYVFFQTGRQIFVYNGNTITTLKPTDNLIENLYKIDQKLLLTDASGSIYEFNGNSFKPILTASGLDISGILPFNQQKFLISTYKNGLFFLENNILIKANINDEVYKRDRIYKLIKHGNGFVLATNRSGIYLLDSNAHLINQTNFQNGLQNNNVLSIYSDKNKNLWLGLDNGIDLVRLNYPYNYLIPDGLLKGTGYCVAANNGRYYFGTNNGLYFRNIEDNGNGAYQLVDNSEGQVWWIQNIDGRLYMSHHDGLFEISGNIAKKVIDIRGCWKLISLKSHPGYFILGTYNGIYVLQQTQTGFKIISKPGPFKESSRFLEEDRDGHIWVGHPYKGLYRITLTEKLTSIKETKRYGKKEGLPDENNNYVFASERGLLFATIDGIYELKRGGNQLTKVQFNGVQNDSIKDLKRIYKGNDDRIWFISEQQVFYIIQDYNGVEYSYKKVVLPKPDQHLVGGFEFLAEFDNGNLFLGSETGFLHINLKKINQYEGIEPKVIITGIFALSNPDSSICGITLPQEDNIQVHERSLEFFFSSPNGSFYNDLNFSTYLEGWDKTWTPWKSNGSREFSQLGYGEYTLHVKARCMGKIGEEIKIKFRVAAPWYWSTGARVGYTILAVIAILLIGFYPQMLVRKKASRIIAEKNDHHKRQTEDLLLQRELQEKELIELRNQQLQKELEHQGRELASSTMHIVQKSEMLLSIKDKLKRISQVSNDPKIKPEIAELIKNIDQDTLIDKDWQRFEHYFNQIHDSYTKSLKEKFPILTANDIKMCSYLRMNLSTKEIASILNISSRGVEVSRYRLRKKMNLENGINLTEYLSKL